MSSKSNTYSTIKSLNSTTEKTFDDLETLRKQASEFLEVNDKRFLEILEEGAELAKKLGALEYQADFLMRGAGRLGNSSKAYEDLKTVGSLCDQMSEETASKFRFRVSNVYGILAFNEQRYDAARQHYLRAIQIAPQTETELRASILINLAKTLKVGFGDFEGATKQLASALRLAAPTGIIQKTALYNLTVHSMESGDLVTARAYLEQAHAISSGSSADLARYYNYNAGITAKEGKLQEALSMAEQSVVAAVINGEEDHLTNGYFVRAEILYDIGDIRGSIKDFMTFLTVRTMKDWFYCLALSSLARNYAALGANQVALESSGDDDSHRAKEYIHLVENLLDTINPSSRSGCLRRLSEASALLGDKTGAYEYLKQSIQLHEKTFNALVKNEMGSLRLLMKIEREEHEKEIEKMKRGQLERELTNTTLQLLSQTELLAEFREGILEVVRKVPPQNQ